MHQAMPQFIHMSLQFALSKRMNYTVFSALTLLPILQAPSPVHSHLIPGPFMLPSNCFKTLMEYATYPKEFNFSDPFLSYDKIITITIISSASSNLLQKRLITLFKEDKDKGQNSALAELAYLGNNWHLLHDLQNFLYF